MIAKNYVELPAEGLVRGCMMDEGNAVTVYLDAHAEEITVQTGNPDNSSDTTTEKVMVGYAVRCMKPVSRDGFIQSAVMTAFGLRDKDALLSLVSSAMTDGTTDEAKEYKAFTAWVETEYDKAVGNISELEAAKEQVLADIEAYDSSSAVNGFTLNGQTVWLDKATRVGLMNSTTIAKAMGSKTTDLWLGEVKLTVDCDKAIQLLSALEMYALECFNVTAAHKKAVSEMTSVEKVTGYDFTKGYPEKLKMEV